MSSQQWLRIILVMVGRLSTCGFAGAGRDGRPKVDDVIKTGSDDEKLWDDCISDLLKNTKQSRKGEYQFFLALVVLCTFGIIGIEIEEGFIHFAQHQHLPLENT
eukprot:scaffold12396_cov154-Skeletonema_menzelii.AAC.4